MIKKITIKNFKSLKNVSINTRQLNLFAGLNGMGKSSFIQTLLMLKQSENIYQTGQLKLKGWLVDIGKGKDALYQFADEDKITFSFQLDQNISLTWPFKYKADWELLELETNIKQSVPSDNIRLARILQTKMQEKYGLITELQKGFQYLSANRIGPKTIHDISQSNIENKILGIYGEYTVHYLQVNGNRFRVGKHMRHKSVSEATLLNQVNGWLGEISPGINVKIVEVPGIDKMLLSYEFDIGIGRTSSFRPENVGFGISYVLSVIVSLLTAEKDNIIIIENPEAHIHPRGQAELGKLMALCASCGAQLFIETHSDHIINGIRVAVKERLINESKVNFCWFNKITTNSEQYTTITEIRIDKNGELSDYPKDFLDEWNNQLLRLV